MMWGRHKHIRGGIKVESLSEADKWDSGLKVLDPDDVSVRVPVKLLAVCNAISAKIDREFSILAKGKWDEGVFMVSDEYVIPKQTVGTASVDYKETLTPYKQQGFTVVIHAHPDGITGFSSADEEHINSQFPCSVLYCKQGFTDEGFTDARVLLNVTEGVKMKLKPKLEIAVSPEAVDMSNITKEVYTVKEYGNDIPSVARQVRVWQGRKGRGRATHTAMNDERELFPGAGVDLSYMGD